MGMGMGMSLSIGMYQRLEQRMELSQACIDGSIAARRANATRGRVMLLRGLQGLDMAPSATCPHCRYHLSLMDIFLGFRRDDPDNTDTECPGCHRRFGAEVSVQGVVGHRTVTGSEPGLSEMIRLHRFLCPPQTLARLPDVAGWEPDKIRVDNPGVFYSAFAHFGSLHTAFRRIPLQYPFEERTWTPREVTREEPIMGEVLQETGLRRKAEYHGYLERVATFYGKAPDTDVASVSRLPLSWVRRDRRSRGIPTYAQLQWGHTLEDRLDRLAARMRMFERRRAAGVWSLPIGQN